VTLQKNIAARVNSGDQFALTVTDGTTPVTAVTTGSTTGVQAATATKSVAGGTALTLSEAISGTSTLLTQYSQAISCINTLPGSTTVLPSGSGTSFSLIPAAGDNITCTITNTPLQVSVQVQKTSTNGTGTFSFVGTNGVAANFAITTVTAGTPVASPVYTVASTGTNVTVIETAPPGWPANPATATCADSNGSASGNGNGSFGTLTNNVLTIPSANIRAGAQIVCTFTNTLAQPTVQISETSISGTGTFSFAGTNGVAANVTITTVTAGSPVSGSAYAVTSTSSSVTVTETPPAGWPANPASAFCTDSNGTVSGNGSGTFGALSNNILTIPSANLKPGAQIVCTFTNTLQVPTVQIATTANGTGTFGYTLTNLNNSSDSITVSTPTGTAATVTSARTSTVTSISLAATIQESSVPGGWPANPVSASCLDTNGAVTGNSGTFGSLTGNTLTIPASYLKSSAQIVCTFTNTAPGTGLVLVKSVDKAAAYPGDVLTYTITYSNSSLEPLTNITISDIIPAYTYNPVASCLNPLPSAITGCTVVTTSSSVSWLLNGSLSPNTSGQVKLSVTIQQ
jgi:uncharacterized repeat protein (TIGR01451 family)